MLSRTDQRPRGSVNSERFAALLDKLVAIQMDLRPVCGVGKQRPQTAATIESIAEACEVLRSAIVDVRGIIYQVNGLTEEAEAFTGSPAGAV